MNTNDKSVLTITDQADHRFKKIIITGSNYTWNVANLKNEFYYLVVENGYNKTSLSFIKQ